MAELWPTLSSAIQGFQLAAARLRMVGSKDACAAAAELEDFINLNIRLVPPMRQTKPEAWGDAAKQSPSKVDSETVRLARDFAARVRGDLSASRLKDV